MNLTGDNQILFVSIYLCVSKRRLTSGCIVYALHFFPSDPPHAFEYDYCAVQRDQMESRAPPLV